MVNMQRSMNQESPAFRHGECQADSEEEVLSLAKGEDKITIISLE